MTPTLSTANLVLRPMAKATQRNIGWLRDPDVVRYSEQRHEKHSLSTQLHYLGSFAGKSHLWGIHTVDSGDHIGNISARHDANNDFAEVGMLIGEKGVWGKGYGTEAWRRTCEWLLDKNGGDIRKLQAGCMRPNEAMLKIIRGSGFTQEGELLSYFLLDGAPVSALLFGRTR